MTTPTPDSYAASTDEQLAELCREHDSRAFQELTRRYLRQIFNFVRQYARSSEDAEDIVQDTFFKVWKNIRKYAKDRAFKPWLFTVARNTALDYVKKRRASTFSELDDADNDLSFADTLEDDEPLQPELFENAASAERLQGVLKELHPDHQSVLTLHYVNELTFDEIARIVGKPMNTVKSWHRRALIKLRDMLSHRAG